MLLVLIIAQWLAIGMVLPTLMALVIFVIYTRCCRLRRLTEEDAKAFETFREVYKCLGDSMVGGQGFASLGPNC